MDIEDILDQEKWLMNHGAISKMAEQNLYMYGALLHHHIVMVEINLHATKKKISYIVYMKDKTYKSYKKFQKLQDTISIFGAIQLWWIKKQYGDLNLLPLLQKFILDYCGKDWQVELEVKSIKECK